MTAMTSDISPHWRSMLIIAAAAILAHAWCLTLPFQADDYILLRGAPSALGLMAPPSPPPGVAPDLLDNTYLFRPVTWILWSGLTWIGGGIAHPVLFHAVSVLLKAVSAVLLLRVLRRTGVSHAAAMVGVLLFATFPGSSQATTWISAQGDQLAVLFMSWVTYRVVATRSEGESWGHVGAVALGTALAVGSKDVALATLPAVAIAWWVTPGLPRRIPWKLLVAVAIGTLAVLSARAWCLGTWSPRYLSPVTFAFGDLVKLPRLFGHALAYWNSAAVFSDVAPVLGQVLNAITGSLDAARIWLVYLAPFALLLPACWGSLVVRWRLHASIAAALACVLIPPLLVYTDSGVQSISRVYEPAGAIMAVWLAVGLHLGGSGSKSGLRLIRLLPLALLVVDFGVHVARTELRAGSHVSARLETLKRISTAAPAGTRIAVIDREAHVGGIPTLYFTIAFASRPPFMSPGIDTVWWPSRDTLSRLDAWFGHAGPVMVVEAASDGIGYVPVGAPLPPRPLTPPGITSRGSSWVFSAPASSREVDGVFAMASWPHREKVVIKAHWRGPEGVATTETAFLGGLGRVAVAIPAPHDWVTRWTEVNIDTQASLDGVSLGLYPTMGIRDLKEGDVRPAWPLAPITFRGGEKSTGYRFLIEVILDDDLMRPIMILRTTPERLLDAGEGWLTFDPSKATDTAIEGIEGGASALVPLLARKMAASGAGRVRAAMRVESIDWWTGMTLARSPWRSFSLSEIVK